MMRESPEQPAQVIDALRVSDRELAGMMARSAEPAAEPVPGMRRQAGCGRDDLPRMLVRICHQRGNCTTYLVKPRDIHEHGMVFLHGSYVHEGAACFAILRDRCGKPTQLAATVFRSRHICGRIHELVAVFDRPIRVDEYQFGDGAALPVPGATSDGKAPAAAGAAARH